MKLWKYFTESSKELYLEERGMDDFNSSKVYDYTVFQNFVIHWVQSGKGYLQIKDQTFALETNDGFILKKGQQVRYWADQEDPWETYWIGLAGERLQECISSSLLSQQPTIRFTPDSQARDILASICQETLEHAPKPAWYSMQVYAFLYHIGEEFPSEMQEDSPMLPLQEAAKLLSQHYAEDIHIQDLADQVGLSRSALFRQFKAAFHKSPQQFLLETRLLKARTLLIETDLPIKEIALNVGYSDQLIFSKAFKKFFSVSPSGYRDRQSGKD